jgi:uracil-DNA glycosylase family 4
MPDEIQRAYTNVVGCIPRGNDSSRKAVVEPSADAIEACRPRLQDFIALCKPKLIVAVGRIAQNALSLMQSQEMFAACVPVVYVVHPSFILQTPCNGDIARRAIATIKSAVIEHVIGSS